MEVGGSGTLEQSLRALRVEGHIGMIGVLSGWADKITTARIMALNATVKGLTVASHDDFQAMCRAIELHSLRPVIGDTFAFDEHGKAFERMQGAGHFGKICLRY